MILLNKKPFYKKENQAGVTLLLSILILGAIMIIIFAVSAITINELKTSGDLTRTEPAITAAGASTEDSLFLAVRGLGTVPDCTAPTIDNSFSNGVVTSTCADYYFSNPYSFVLGSLAQRFFYLYNPADQTVNPGYTGVSITMSNGTAASVWFCQFSVGSCGSGAPTYTLTSGAPTANISGLDPAQKYTLVITNSNSTDSETFSMTGTPRGLPSGITTIQSTGSFRGATRKIRTTVPQ